MPKVSDIAAFLEEKVPSALMESYDNVGLLCGFPEQEVTRILVVLDVTLEAIRTTLPEEKLVRVAAGSENSVKVRIKEA